ncbi:MAG: hypothetical protein LCH69_19715 [Proteobacteria bacterium]|nr:hypothetical protein [Pseudomonadota bacterium]
MPMRTGIILALLLIPLALRAAEVTYSGDDALRLKCATMLSLASSFAAREGRSSPEDSAKSKASAAHLLQGLPGNNDEKARAMQVTADRLMLENTPDELQSEFRRTLPGCARFF